MNEPTVPETHGAGRLPYSIGDVLFGVVVAVMCSWTLTGLWQAFEPQPTQKVTIGLMVAALVGIWVGLLGTPLWVSWRRGTKSLIRDFQLRFELPRDAVSGLLLGIFVQVVLVWVIYLPLRIFSPSLLDDVSSPAQQLTDAAHGWQIAILALCVIIGSPVIEELFFRGFMQPVLIARFGEGNGIAIAAVVFGLIHFEPLQMPALIALGGILGIVVRRTGRLGPAIFAHMAFNAVTVVLLVGNR